MNIPFFGSSFSKIGRRKPRTFSYTPRVYDEEKESLEKRKRYIERKVAQEKGEKDAGYVPSRNINFRSATKTDRLDVRKSKRSSNLRLILILGLLIMGFIYAIRRVEELKLLD